VVVSAAVTGFGKQSSPEGVPGQIQQRDHAEGTEMKATNVYQLKRNDVEGAILLRSESIAQGRWREEDEEIILKLQDDPAALIKRIAQVDKENPVIEVDGMLVLRK
jgi:hypothetical protein